MISLTFVLASNPRFLQLLHKIFNRKKMMLLAFCIEKKAADYSVESGCQCLCLCCSPPPYFLLTTQSYLRYLLSCTEECLKILNGQ